MYIIRQHELDPPPISYRARMGTLDILAEEKNGAGSGSYIDLLEVSPKLKLEIREKCFTMTLIGRVL